MLQAVVFNAIERKPVPMRVLILKHVNACVNPKGSRDAALVEGEGKIGEKKSSDSAAHSSPFENRHFSSQMSKQTSLVETDNSTFDKPRRFVPFTL